MLTSLENTIQSMRQAGIDISAAMAEKIIAITSTTPYKEHDRGTLNAHEMISQLHELFPEQWQQDLALRVVYENNKRRTLINAGLEILKAVKERGYKVYILSNFSRISHEQICTFPNFVEQFDGSVFSYEMHQVKPELSIYKTLLERYQLDPHEYLFIDDLAQNIQAGLQVGIDGIVLHDHEQTMNDLKKLEFL